MPAYIFDDLLLKGVRNGQIPGMTEVSKKWYRQQAQKTTMTPGRLMREDATRLKNKTGIGQMAMFFYDPKHKKTLPFYDKFPCIFLIKQLPDGFLGINLHYLPVPLRAKLMDALYELTSNKKMNEATKLKISYEILNGASKYKWFKPTVKRYLNKHVRSRFLHIAASEWDMAMTLPVAQWEKASQSAVYKESRAIISGSK